MGMMEYKGYSGSAEFDIDTGIIHGKILFVNDLITYQTTDGTKIKAEFEAAVEDYLDTCKALDREPQKPFNGVFNVRVTPGMHKAAAIRAAKDGVKLNGLVVAALEQYLSDQEVKHTHTHSHHVEVSFTSTSMTRVEATAGTYKTITIAEPARHAHH